MQRLFDHLDPHLVARLRLQLEITHTLRAQLPEEVGAKCWCSHIEEGVMTVTVSDGNRIALIHFQQKELLKCINANFKERLNRPLHRLKVQLAAHRTHQG